MYTACHDMHGLMCLLSELLETILLVIFPSIHVHNFDIKTHIRTVASSMGGTSGALIEIGLRAGALAYKEGKGWVCVHMCVPQLNCVRFCVHVYACMYTYARKQSECIKNWATCTSVYLPTQ
jgi:hypothetical protein